MRASIGGVDYGNTSGFGLGPRLLELAWIPYFFCRFPVSSRAGTQFESHLGHVFSYGPPQGPFLLAVASSRVWVRVPLVTRSCKRMTVRGLLAGSARRDCGTWPIRSGWQWLSVGPGRIHHPRCRKPRPVRGPAKSAASNVQVWFDGKLLYSRHRVGTGFTTLTCVQLGAEHPRQAGDGYIDDVVINATQSGSAITFGLPGRRQRRRI
jgi:hypothetical protein